MPDLIRFAGGPLGLTALLLSLVTVVVAVVVALRGPRTRERLVPVAARTGLVLGTLVVAVLLFTPVTRTLADRAVDLDVRWALESALSSRTMFWQLVGNLLLFTWLALLLPLAFRRITGVTAVLICAAASLTVEVLQYASGVGRVSAASDVVLNVAGAVIVTTIAAVVRSSCRLFRARPAVP